MKKCILWFRRDLRLHDNTALNQALQNGFEIIPVYILDDENAGPWKMGGASRWWLHHSLKSLNDSLSGAMIFKQGPADEILPRLINETGADAVFWNRCYEPWRIARDTKVKQILKSRNIQTETFKDSVLWEPWEVTKDDATPYKVFTPFYRKGCLKNKIQPVPPNTLPLNPSAFGERERGEASGRGSLNHLNLLPAIPWYKTMETTWKPGEDGARATLNRFLKDGLSGYKELRNRPDLEKISRLSPHLHFGEISIRDVWFSAQSAGIAQGVESDLDHFLSELGWREFSTSLLYYNQNLPTEPIQKRFEKFPWIENNPALKLWQAGQTGIPIIDAGMRQLWQTGWMHNRVRMIVASFLVKNLLIHWTHGEKWFWDCLVDADLANNAASWQWVAGCGADAAPYFRIFNPVTQGQKFDPDGNYVRKYVPELKDIPAKFIHTPWEINVPDYPPPIADLAQTRTRALDAFEEIK
jgi:deoxyribodipyrimidine photo-lyase